MLTWAIPNFHSCYSEHWIWNCMKPRLLVLSTFAEFFEMSDSFARAPQFFLHNAFESLRALPVLSLCVMFPCPTSLPRDLVHEELAKTMLSLRSILFHYSLYPVAHHDTSTVARGSYIIILSLCICVSLASVLWTKDLVLFVSCLPDVSTVCTTHKNTISTDHTTEQNQLLNTFKVEGGQWGHSWLHWVFLCFLWFLEKNNFHNVFSTYT